jgi:hypothetical protein
MPSIVLEKTKQSVSFGRNVVVNSLVRTVNRNQLQSQRPHTLRISREKSFDSFSYQYSPHLLYSPNILYPYGKFSGLVPDMIIVKE